MNWTNLYGTRLVFRHLISSFAMRYEEDSLKKVFDIFTYIKMAILPLSCMLKQNTFIMKLIKNNKLLSL